MVYGSMATVDRPATRGRKLGVACVAVVLLAAAACSSSGSSGAKSTATTSSKPYKVEIVVGLSGPLQPFGEANVSAMRAAADVINQAGGMNGRQITIEAKDDQGNSTQAVSIVQSVLASSTPPDLLYLGTGSTEALAMVPLTTSAKVLSIEQAAAADLANPSKFPYNFSVSANTESGYEALGSEFQSKGYKKVAILTSGDAFGGSENTNAVNEFKKLGIDYKSVTYDPKAVDLTPQLEQLQAYKPDVLYFVAYGPSAGHIIENLHTLGWNIPTIGSPAVASTNLTSLVPAADLAGIQVEAFRIEQYIAPAQRPANLSAMITALKKQGAIKIPLYVYAFTYDGLQLVHLGVQQAKSTDVAAVTHALENLTQPTDKPYVSFPTESYSATQHSLTATPDDFVFLPEGPLVDGMLGAPAGTNP